MGQSQREKCLLLSKVIDFYASHDHLLWPLAQNYGHSFKSTFCVSYLLYLLWKRTNFLPPSPCSSLSICHFCQPPRCLSLDLLRSFGQGCILWVLGAVLGQCWCVTAAGVSPPSPALPQFCVPSQAHTSSPHTIWRLVPSPLMAQLWNQDQLLLNLAFSGKWLATWLFLVIPSKARSQENEKPVGFLKLGIKIWSWQSQS